MAGKYRLVDAMTGMPSPPRKDARKLDPNIARWFKPSKQMSEGATLEDMVADMDAGDVEFAHLHRRHHGTRRQPNLRSRTGYPGPAFRSAVPALRRGPATLSRPLQVVHRIGPDPSHDRGQAAGEGGQGVWLYRRLHHAVDGRAAAQSCFILPDLRQVRGVGPADQN